MTNIDLDDLARVTGGSIGFPPASPPTTGPTFPSPFPPPCDPGPCRPPNPPFGSTKGV
ncbi:MAG TPA: hypothetical protein VGL61_32995 [Kofleriaceae bacterium]|nr:hypothetical protein [Kofleriaceae bacterium]